MNVLIKAHFKVGIKYISIQSISSFSIHLMKIFLRRPLVTIIKSYFNHETKQEAGAQFLEARKNTGWNLYISTRVCKVDSFEKTNGKQRKQN